jgi:hypothetical protein
MEFVRRSRGETQELVSELTRALQNGEIQIPQLTTRQPALAGGTNHAPNSDFSYSKDAATVSGTLPGTAGDGNQEAYRWYRQAAGANVTVSSANALKAVGHSGFAAAEGADLELPRWDRVNGWAEIGSDGAQYDLVAHLPAKIVSPGQRWYVRFQLGALNSTLLPAAVQAFAGFWHKTSGSEGWVQGGNFTLSHEIHGTPGSQSIDYRVLAKTDSGVSVLSDILNVPNAPDVLSTSDYVKLFYDAGPGFITFEIHRKIGAAFSHVYTVRNSSDLQYNDVGIVHVGGVQGWPAVTDSAPRAYAETKNLRVGSFGQVWQSNDLQIVVPSTYDFSETEPDGLFLRVGLTAPTAVNRHVGLDRVWLSTTYNEWAPDVLRLPDGSSPVPSISPTSGFQGGGGGVFEPPQGGSGGATCVRLSTPVLTVQRGRNVFRAFKSCRVGERLRGESRLPYVATAKRQGTVSEFYVIKTANGVTVECSLDHPFVTDLVTRKTVEARHLEAGTRLAAWARGRKTYTKVSSVKLVPKPTEVGTFTLAHSGGEFAEGAGLYVAGRSKGKDRGLYCHNIKRDTEAVLL